MPAGGTRVGVLLAGCGTHDGSEIGEALLTLLELERRGAQPMPLVPSGEQMHVVDHASGDESTGSTRSMAAEAARITRGKVEILGTTSPSVFHALIIPGGSGVIKNLMTGTLEPGSRRALLPAVRELLVHFLQAGKPMGIMSVANFLLPGLVDSPILPERAGTPGEPLLVDPGHRLVYAPAFLTARSLAEVAEGVSALVEMVLHYVDETRP